MEVRPISGAERQRHCFVVGPIGNPGSNERKHADLMLHAVIKSVLEGGPFCYRVRRADEDVSPGMIGSRIVIEVTTADLVVADLTGLNPNVFYELGIRHSAEKPTIHIASHGTTLPFDNAPHHTIFIDLSDWHSQERARKQLRSAALAIQREDFVVSNPITQANASFRMQHSADPNERVIAELKREVEVIRAQLSKDEIARSYRGSSQEALLLPETSSTLRAVVEAEIRLNPNRTPGQLARALERKLGSILGSSVRVSPVSGVDHVFAIENDGLVTHVDLTE